MFSPWESEASLIAGEGAGTFERNPASAADLKARLPLSDSDLLDAYSRAVVQVVQTMGPSVVSISVQRKTNNGVMELSCNRWSAGAMIDRLDE